MTNRREFLQILGLGGIAASSGLSLFSSGSEYVIGRGEHFVFSQSGPLLPPGARAHFLFKGDDSGGVMRLMLRSPTAGRRPWSPTGEPCIYTVPVHVPEGEDPHISFFLAASELQRKIGEDVLEFSRELRDFSLVMVTVVNTPIIAMPNQDRGFYLFTEMHQYAVEKADVMNLDEAVSSNGEVPIEPPSDITFKYLLLMQKELEEMGMLRSPSRSNVQHALRR